MIYKEYPLGEAYTLQNAGGLVLICTRGSDGKYDLAPVAWCCPLDYEPVSRFLCVLDTGHKTFKDIEASRVFAIALPVSAQKDLVMRCGAVSGFKVDKYKEFGIQSRPGTSIDVKIPAGVAGWIECSLSNIVVEGTSGIVMGNALHAEAVVDAWKQRLHFVS
ncbi:MAG TPA: flavin reductase, partial [Rectinemataceae bacterium]|nr:flavin reductase [Rectinemataceae bacterium]